MSQALRSYYPPDATLENLHKCQAVSAETPEECHHLEDLHWQPVDRLMAVLKQSEKQRQEEAQKAAEQAKTKAAHDAAEQAELGAQEAKRQKATDTKEAKRQAKLSAYEARTDFLVRTARAQQYPLEERRRAISNNVLVICQKFAECVTDAQREELAVELVALYKERRDTSSRIQAIDSQLQADTEAARSCLN